MYETVPSVWLSMAIRAVTFSLFPFSSATVVVFSVIRNEVT